MSDSHRSPGGSVAPLLIFTTTRETVIMKQCLFLFSCRHLCVNQFWLMGFHWLISLTDWSFFLCRLLWSEGRKTTLSQWGNGHQIKSPHPKKDLHRWWAAWNYVRSPNYYEWWRCKLHYKCSKANKVREMSIKHSLYTHIHSREDVSLSAISENTPVGIPLMCVGLTSP